MFFINGESLIHSVSHPLAQSGQRAYETPTKFDPDRNSAEDLAAAVEEAKRTQRNVLIEIGAVVGVAVRRTLRFLRAG
jgi:hypothetical protein